MTTLHPRWARVVGAVWFAVGVVLFATGAVVIVDQHDLLRWEFPLGVAAVLFGLRAWSRSVSVDAHGIEQRIGRGRTRLLWSTVDRVAVGSRARHGGPVQVWRSGAEEPVVLDATWGTSRAQRAQLAGELERLVGIFGVAVTSDVDTDVGRGVDEGDVGTDDEASPPAPGGTPEDAWTAQGRPDA